MRSTGAPKGCRGHVWKRVKRARAQFDYEKDQKPPAILLEGPLMKAARLEPAVAVIAGAIPGFADSMLFDQSRLVPFGAGIGIALGVWALGRAILDRSKQD